MCVYLKTDGGRFMLRISADFDLEHIRIMRELEKYGVPKTGKKTIDKERLENVKEKEIKAERIAEMKLENHEGEEYINRAHLEELKIGAMTLAEINRVILGL